MKRVVNDTYINNVIMIGNVGRIGEIKELSGGLKKLDVSLVTEKKEKGGEPKATWHNLSFWGKSAEIQKEWLSQGDKIYIEGELDVWSYEKDGVKKSYTSINVNRSRFISLSKGRADDGSETRDNAEDIPF